jgi:hypothetical protein
VSLSDPGALRLSADPRAPRVRPAVVAALLSCGGMLLTGCGVESEPLVTVFSPGSGSVTVSPQCWSPDEVVSERDCASTSNLGRIEVQPGATIGVNVDPEIAELGWVPTVGGERLVAQDLDTTYYRFALSESNFADTPDPALEIFAVDEDQKTRGLWVLQLTRR